MCSKLKFWTQTSIIAALMMSSIIARTDNAKAEQLRSNLSNSLKTICQTAVEHVPDVDVEYKPGVDVRGKPVVPADLNAAPPQAIFDPVMIPVEIDLLEKYGIEAPRGVELKPTVAQLEIYKDGRILYNGQDITSQTQTMCSGASTDRTKNSDRQKSHNPIKDIETEALKPGKSLGIHKNNPTSGHGIWSGEALESDG